MKTFHFAFAFAFALALSAGSAFAGDKAGDAPSAGPAGMPSAPSELPQQPGHGDMSPSTSALRNPNDPNTKAAETRSTDDLAETGRGDKTGDAGTVNLETGEKKSPKRAEAERLGDESLSGRQH